MTRAQRISITRIESARLVRADGEELEAMRKKLEENKGEGKKREAKYDGGIRRKKEAPNRGSKTCR